MTKRLPSELRSAINKAAHAAGLAHAEQVKRELMVKAETALAGGKPAAEVMASMTAIARTALP